MSDQARVSHPIYDLLPAEIEGFDSLAELALDLRWSWNHATDRVWRQLDPILWELTQNPWVVLQTVSRDQLKRVLADPAFRKNVDDLLRSKRQAAELDVCDAWPSPAIEVCLICHEVRAIGEARADQRSARESVLIAA